MLFYRRAEGENQVRDKRIPECPAHLAELLARQSAQEEVDRQLELKAKQERLSQLNLKVIYDKRDSIFSLKLSSTIADLKEAVKEYFDIRLEDRNWRLRHYAYLSQIAKENYDGKEECTLASLHVKDFQNFIVETKTDAEQFEDYDPNSILLRINVWRPNILNLDSNHLMPIE